LMQSAVLLSGRQEPAVEERLPEILDAAGTPSRHTGWAEAWLAATPEQRAARAGSPGIGQSHEMLAWLWDHHIALFAADNGGLEAFLHRQLIALLGLNCATRTL
jgi:hypothetical protein